jgi:internalin A
VQEKLREAERRIAEARRTGAEVLDLGDLALSELPASLGDLPDLRALYLGTYRPGNGGQAQWDEDRKAPDFADLAPLAGLQSLQSLNLSDCPGVTDLAPIASLQALQSLYFWYCRAVEDLAPIATLQALQSLDLIDCHAVTDLAPIAKLKALQSLNLGSCFGVTDLAPIAKVEALQSLNLDSCHGVTDLAPIAKLKALQSLNLDGCYSVTDLAPVAELQALQSLYLMDCTGVTDLAPLGNLPGLQTLNLCGCAPPLSQQLLRYFADHPCLTRLIADKAAGVLREVLSRHYRDNCLPRLRAHLAELDSGAETENELKVILLGNGRVGKTQLCRRFRGEPFDGDIPSTHGVQIWREELRLLSGGEEKAFQVSWWDFGGQDIYHGTHALFLRSRAVFLILWTPGLENREESEENGIPLRNQPLAYWLDYVRSLAGQGSPVIVVQSQCDRFSDQRPAPPIPEGLGFVQSCFYSAKKDLGREVLEGQLCNAIGYLVEQNGKLQIGRGRAEVRRRLYAWRSADQKRKPAKRKHRTLTLDQFRTLCDEAGDIVSWEAGLDYFHQTGVVFYDRRLFNNCIVLDQSWALDAVYTVFNRSRAAPFLRDSGRFTRKDLAFLAWPDHSLAEQKLFLGLMESCGVCFSIGKTAQGEERYVAPDLLPQLEAVAGRVHLTWKPEAETATLRLESRFFHPAIIRGLMSEIGKRAGDLAEYWKYGLWFKDGKRDTQLLAQFLAISNAEAPGAGALELKAQGSDPLGLLREIRRSFSWQRIGEDPEELLTLGGITIARSSLSTRTNDGRALDTAGNWAPAEAFAAFFANREHRPEAKQAAIDITPQAPRPDEKLPAVFISYAWGDDSPEGKVRTQVVDGLYTALEEDGFVPMRDRDQLRSGELISAFIRQLTRADLVVTVISDKYLRSPYCMQEIYRLWQRCQEDPAELAKCVVPIVLPDAKIGHLRDRAAYLRHWRDEAREHDRLYEELRDQLDPETVKEIRLVREFSQHVDGILKFLQDVLMPRQLEARLDQGFPAVLSALRRRIQS